MAKKPIWEVAAELGKSIPLEERKLMPKDGVEQHDKYLYGGFRKGKIIPEITKALNSTGEDNEAA